MQKFFNLRTTSTNDDMYITLELLAPVLSESGFICLGHGTGRSGNSNEVVESIFNNGLRTKDNSLYYTTIVLSTPTPELKQQYVEMGLPEPTIERLKNQFNNWQHLESKKIIIARIPTEYINQMGDRSDRDGEMYGAFYTQKILPDGKSINYLDSKFIVGCFDVEKQAVRLNKKFERTLTPETIEKLKVEYKRTLEKTNIRLQSFESKNVINNTENQFTTVGVDDKYLESFDFDDEIEWEDTNTVGIKR